MLQTNSCINLIICKMQYKRKMHQFPGFIASQATMNVNYKKQNMQNASNKKKYKNIDFSNSRDVVMGVLVLDVEFHLAE